MPEIAEIARIVSLLKTNLVNKPIKKVLANEDEIVYGKVGTSASAFIKAMTGKTVVDVKQQGKYFWLEMSSPPHALMHFGMTGWIKMNSVYTPYWEPKNGEEKEWPPRFEKFRIITDDGEASFVDARRLGRIRLVDVDAKVMRDTTPLKENGPDPHIDKDVLTKEWLRKKLRSKKVPVKALLLDQANISGIGNWVGDEVLFKARIHPEQYSNTFSDEESDRLHDAIMYIIDTAIANDADKNKFPADWLFTYRKAGKLPTGEKITLLKVGGRTSAVVPSLQKKTGPVAGEVDSKHTEPIIKVKDESENETAKPKAKKETSKKRKATDNDTKPVKKENLKPTNGRTRSARNTDNY